ncbi:glycosyltransferase family 8 protein [Streptococcus pneumoniae]
MSMNIAMAADVYYKDQLEVAMKSIMLHNRNIHFFLLNKDFSAEWFEEMNRYLQDFDSDIVDCKIKSDYYKEFSTNAYITEATFYRYHIPEFIEGEKALYLDVDLIVTENLRPFYDTDIREVGLAAVLDVGAPFLHGINEFNAGVLLINLEKWREKKVLEAALEIHRDSQITLLNADQTVLNILFEGEWLELSDAYNHQVFAEFPYVRRHNPAKKSPIIHYTTSVKPFTKFHKKLKGMVSLLIKHRKITLSEFIRYLYKIPLADEWNQVAQMTWTEVRNSQHESHKN